MSKQKFFKVFSNPARRIFFLALLGGGWAGHASAAEGPSAISPPSPVASAPSAPASVAEPNARFVSRHEEAAFYGFGFLGLLLFGVGAGAGGISRRERYRMAYRTFPYGSYFDQRCGGGPPRLYGASSGLRSREG